MALTMVAKRHNWPGRVESKLADDYNIAVMIDDGEVELWDYDFNDVMMTFPK